MVLSPIRTICWALTLTSTTTHLTHSVMIIVVIIVINRWFNPGCRVLQAELIHRVQIRGVSMCMCVSVCMYVCIVHSVGGQMQIVLYWQNKFLFQFSRGGIFAWQLGCITRLETSARCVLVRLCLCLSLHQSFSPFHTLLFSFIFYTCWRKNTKHEWPKIICFCNTNKLTHKLSLSQVRLNNTDRFYSAYIQDVSPDDGPVTVFIEELGNKYVWRRISLGLFSIEIPVIQTKIFRMYIIRI